MKTIQRLLILFLIAGSVSALAQKVEKKYFADQKWQNEQLEIRISHAVSTAKYLKFKITFVNKGASNLIFKPAAMAIRIGDSVYMAPGELTYIEPYANTATVVNFPGNHLKHNGFKIESAGVYMEAGNPLALNLPDFDIPGSPEFRDSMIYLRVEALKRMKKLTYVKFYVRYAGEGTLKIECGKSMVRVPSGSEHTPNNTFPYFLYIDKYSDDSHFSFTYTLPVSVANMATDKLNILWKDMFQMINLSQVPFETMTISLDAKKTKDRN